MQNSGKDYLSGTDIYLMQRKDMFRCNTDTALLGNFMKVKQDETILDIGCNNGALMLYASLHSPKHIYGIDIFEEAVELARQNLSDNNVENITLLHGDVTESEVPCVDVVVCNPPYFNTGEQGNLNKNEFLRVARHEGTLNLNSLFEVVSSCLEECGRFYLVHRAARLNDIMAASKMTNLRAKSLKMIYDVDKDEATAILIEFEKNYQGDVKVLLPYTVKRG